MTGRKRWTRPPLPQSRCLERTGHSWRSWACQFQCCSFLPDRRDILLSSPAHPHLHMFQLDTQCTLLPLCRFQPNRHMCRTSLGSGPGQSLHCLLASCLPHHPHRCLYWSSHCQMMICRHPCTRSRHLQHRQHKCWKQMSNLLSRNKPPHLHLLQQSLSWKHCNMLCQKNCKNRIPCCNMTNCSTHSLRHHRPHMMVIRWTSSMLCRQPRRHPLLQRHPRLLRVI